MRRSRLNATAPTLQTSGNRNKKAPWNGARLVDSGPVGFLRLRVLRLPRRCKRRATATRKPHGMGLARKALFKGRSSPGPALAAQGTGIQSGRYIQTPAFRYPPGPSPRCSPARAAGQSARPALQASRPAASRPRRPSRMARIQMPTITGPMNLNSGLPSLTCSWALARLSSITAGLLLPEGEETRLLRPLF